MDALVGILERRKPDALVILGDLTEDKDRHSANLVNMIVRELSEMASVVPIAILMGNHDYLNEGHPFFAFVRHIPNIEWIGKISTGAMLKGPKFRSIFDGCLFLPHTRNHERDWADLINPGKASAETAFGLRFDQYRVVFAHNTFNGAEVGWGRKLEGIPLDIFPKKTRVVAGDIHRPQTLGPVTYVGPPYTVNFGDDYKPRMLSITGDLVSVSVDAWPQKRLLEISDVKELPKAKEGDIYKVRVQVGTLVDWANIHQMVRDWAAEQGVILYRCEPIMTHRVVNKRVRVDASEGPTDEKLVRQYAKRHTLEDKTLAVGLELLK
jgi:DNA repair exonuclease SbcCD nuclease subunit